MARHDDLDGYLRSQAATLGKGPIAIVFVEDEVEVDSTLRHALANGFKTVLALADKGIAMSRDVEDAVERISYDTHADAALETGVNAVIAAAPGAWLHYCYNAEYLFYPFCENRTVGEMLMHATEERRDSVLTYVIDLYAGDLDRCPGAVDLEDAHLDKSGYYALARYEPGTTNSKDRQLDFYGGLRWRFEEHISVPRRKIDRIALLKAKPGLRLLADHTVTDEEMNTFACPWHHNLTAALCSFRTAKALKRNPGSTFEIDTFRWHNSAPFEWHSQQLLDLGLMEPGQWF